MGKEGSVSRRTSVRRIGAIGAAAVLGGSSSAAGAAGNNKKADAFALVGDRYHNSDYIRTALGKTLVEEAGLSIDFTDGGLVGECIADLAQIAHGQHEAIRLGDQWDRCDLFSAYPFIFAPQ